jgi:hypothetical protein
MRCRARAWGRRSSRLSLDGCHEAETALFPALPAVAARALRLTDDACWASLTQGDAEGFRREAAIGAELWSFGVCACLLDERAAAGGPASRPG